MKLSGVAKSWTLRLSGVTKSSWTKTLSGVAMSWTLSLSGVAKSSWTMRKGIIAHLVYERKGIFLFKISFPEH